MPTQRHSSVSAQQHRGPLHVAMWDCGHVYKRASPQGGMTMAKRPSLFAAATAPACLSRTGAVPARGRGEEVRPPAQP